MYGKVMSIPDNLIMLYYELLTDVPDPELDEMAKDLESNSVNPMDLKKRLAADIVKQFHSRDEARKAEERFAREVQKKELPEDMPERKVRTAIKAVDQKKGIVTVSVPALLVETNLVASAGEAKRLIAQGAVEIDGEKVTDNDWKAASGAVLKVGKRRFCRIMVDMNAGSGRG